MHSLKPQNGRRIWLKTSRIVKKFDGMCCRHEPVKYEEKLSMLFYCTKDLNKNVKLFNCLIGQLFRHKNPWNYKITIFITFETCRDKRNLQNEKKFLFFNYVLAVLWNADILGISCFDTQNCNYSDCHCYLFRFN